MQRGGKTVYGASVGILMLESQFPRIPGDMGNALTWPFPVHYRVVRGATPDKIVRGDPRIMVDVFIEAGRDLISMGCDGITTNCGFLSLIQDEVKEALGVPVMTSALMQVPMVQHLLPAGQRVGIITIAKDALTEDHLTAAAVPLDTPIVGTEGGKSLTRDILGNAVQIDFDQCRLDMREAATRLVTEFPEIGAIVLECTNMVPYAQDIRMQTGRAVFSIYSFVTWFQSGLAPAAFEARLNDPRWN